MRQGLQRAVLGLDPVFEQVYRRARQLNETRFWNYRTVGDLNVDGYNEVLIDQWTFDEDPSGLFLFGLTGRYSGTVVSGRDGEELLSVDSEFVDGFTGLRRFRVGPDGKPGLLLVESSLFSAAYTVTYTAIDGEGSTVWRRSLPSTYNWNTGSGFFISAATDALVGANHVDVRPGKADDLVIAQADYVNLPQRRPVARTRVGVIQGETGELTYLPVSEVSTETIPIGGGVPDIDGDRSDDVVMLGKSSDDEGHVHTFSGKDGTPIWATELRLKGYFWTEGIGRFTRDATPDFLVAQDRAAGRRFAVVDGATGKVQWERRGIFPYVIGDIDRDGRPDIGAFRFVRGEKRSKDVFLAFANGGGRLYEVAHGLDMSDCHEQFCFTFGFYLDAGDLNADGVKDRYVELSTSWSNELVTYMVNGRTGRRMHDVSSRPIPLLGTVDGHGDDVGVAKDRGTPLALKVLTGRDLRPMWNTTFQGRGARRLADVFAPYDGAVTLKSSRCDDVLFGVMGRGTVTLFALDGRDGSVLWRSGVGGPPKATARNSVTRKGC
jgi:hypothetical protein